TSVELSSKGLEGSLSPHVGNLSFLHELSLKNNPFKGSIPHEVGRLPRLRRLYLDTNKFSGVIPTNLSGCSNLKELWLARNNLVGSITKEMSLLSKLVKLVIYDNKLTGGISLFLGNITSMEVFTATRNPLGGSIPYTLGLWKSLMAFHSGGYNLYGSIPPSIFNLSLLVSFSLAENHLTSSIPSKIGNQSPNIELLQLRTNELTGVLPPSISNCSKLRYFEMSHNIFSGKLTIDFSKLRDINIIRLADINLHGRGEADDMRSASEINSSIPSDFKDLKLLSGLDLSYTNLLSTITSSLGKIPQFLEKWNSLKFLNQSFNDFEGEVPVKKCNNQPSESSGNDSRNEWFSKVSYNQLRKATDGFSIANLIGEGRFSFVYKGTLKSDDDRFIAVKVIHLQNQGARKRNDFNSLVYEFMLNGSVHDWLHSSANTSRLNLIQRIKILIDVATTLDYLHNCCQTIIVHGDLKPSNILLDDDMVAHVDDFGLARLLGADSNQNISTGVKGTIGYAPPKYGIGSDMTSSGDVYSFGMLLLEVMTGKKPTHDVFNYGLSLHNFSYMALPDHVVDVIDGDVIVLQCKEVNAKKLEECLVATIKNVSRLSLILYGEVESNCNKER
ncbi:kinase-like domain-containing protein, partial [Tanacetum coccineum]